MPSNRKKAEDYIINLIAQITPNSDKNKKLYQERFKQMSDDEFDRFMKRLATEDEILMIVSPNHADDGISIENNLAIGEKLGHKFFTKVFISGQEGLPDHLTPIEYMVLDLPVRRLSQTSDKKIKVPKSTDVIDSLTGQVTGESKGAALSAPEIQVLSAMGLEASLIETMKYRGGDKQGRLALIGLISKYGSARLETLDQYQNGVESTYSLRTFLSAAHLKNNL